MYVPEVSIVTAHTQIYSWHAIVTDECNVPKGSLYIYVQYYLHSYT